MVREDDRRSGFERFMEGVNGLLADENLREVLLELDAEGEEAVALLAPDPAAFLKHRGVRIPEDFRLSIEERSEEAAARAGGSRPPRTVCYCLRICWWRWCIEICVCRRTSVA
jgi:hypothetical protein